MKKTVLIVGLLAAVGAGGYFAYGKLLKKSPLDRGTEVKLVLMQQLEAGKDPEGTSVKLMVAEDVLTAGGGGIAIHKGSLLSGKISQSRGENALAAITNKPARLELMINQAIAADGQAIKLTSANNGILDQPISLNRGNTGRQNLSAKLQSIASDPEVMRALSQIERSFKEGGRVDVTDETTKRGFEKIAKQLNMKNLEEVVLGNRVAEVNSVLDSAEKVGTVLSDPLAIGAVLELANIAGEIGSKLGQMLKGRKIIAYPGTPISVFVGETTQVHPG